MLALTLTISFYTTLVAPIWIAFFGLYTLIVYPLGRVLRRWVPVSAGFIVLCIPILMARGSLSLGRSGLNIERPPLMEGLAALWGDYGGDIGWLWIGLLIVGVAAWSTRRHQFRPVIGLTVWGFGGLLFLYALHPVLGFFRPSYAFWTLTAFALLGAVLLARLPRAGQIVVTGIMMILLFVPVPARVSENYSSPGVAHFAWLRAHVRAGDVVALDPNFDCLSPYELDYLARAFFPEGLTMMGTIPEARRVWLARNVNTEDQAFGAAITSNRRPSIFIGPPTCLVELHEAPPDEGGIAFANGMRFHGGEMVEAMPDQFVPILTPPVAREGEMITVRLWWSVDSAPPTDLSVGVYVQDADGRVVSQVDSAPQVDPPQTSRWQNGVFYVEERTLTLPYPFTSGDYRVSMSVYQAESQTLIQARGMDSDGLLALFILSVKSW